MRVLKRTGDHYATGTRGFTLTLPIELFRRLQQIQDRARTARMDMGGCRRRLSRTRRTLSSILK